ncbi:hypothetical protein BDV59DRAFT_177433 [Aspergillus ambiguus]|uniref:uncharacterized protein n=1 Tax=Aspergillus ambiguus TaxID=176160 RepID=UPI003CCDE08E
MSSTELWLETVMFTASCMGRDITRRKEIFVLLFWYRPGLYIIVGLDHVIRILLSYQLTQHI